MATPTSKKRKNRNESSNNREELVKKQKQNQDENRGLALHFLNQISEKKNEENPKEEEQEDETESEDEDETFSNLRGIFSILEDFTSIPITICQVILEYTENRSSICSDCKTKIKHGKKKMENYPINSNQIPNHENSFKFFNSEFNENLLEKMYIQDVVSFKKIVRCDTCYNPICGVSGEEEHHLHGAGAIVCATSECHQVACSSCLPEKFQECRISQDHEHEPADQSPFKDMFCNNCLEENVCQFHREQLERDSEDENSDDNEDEDEGESADDNRDQDKDEIDEDSPNHNANSNN